MASNQITMPSSGGGIMRFSEGTGTKVGIKPQQVVILIVLVVIIELILKFWGNSIFFPVQ